MTELIFFYKSRSIRKVARGTLRWYVQYPGIAYISPAKTLPTMDHIYLIQIYIEIKLTLALSDIADPIIFAKKGLATFCCPSYPNGG